MDIASIHNNHEKAVFACVQEMAEHFPHIQDNPDMLAAQGRLMRTLVDSAE